jgi:hypothetical protein
MRGVPLAVRIDPSRLQRRHPRGIAPTGGDPDGNRGAG